MYKQLDNQFHNQIWILLRYQFCCEVHDHSFWRLWDQFYDQFNDQLCWRLKNQIDHQLEKINKP